MDGIEKLRLIINDIDKELMRLLDQRFELTTEIGHLKAQQKKAVLDQNREQVILDKASTYNHSPQLQAIYKTIMEQSKQLQRK